MRRLFNAVLSYALRSVIGLDAVPVAYAGDTLVVRSKARIAPASVANMRAYWRDAIPRTRLMILDADLDVVAVIRHEAQSEHSAKRARARSRV